ncbi:MAG: response regulator [Candidatus Rokubacteria bacterium]|nr:response regulator [Candidatus Rokubacteria bacterium]
MLTVLIVDDEPNIVELVRVTLEDDHVRVVIAVDAETALARAAEARPDLILLDVQLPDRSGLEVCRLLRRDPRFTRTRIVMLTAASQQADVGRGLAAGADVYLTKPFSPVRLLALVDSLFPHETLWVREP